MRRLSVLVALVVLATWPGAASPPPTSSPPTSSPPTSSSEGRHVVLISIDGLKPDYYLRADDLGLAIPNLRRLMAEGAFAHGVVGVLPTVTYPSHTTLITGVPPREHGIVSNRVLDPEGRSGDAWYWYASEVRVPTLVSVARARHRVTAAVSWPVSLGMDVDFNLPEFWRGDSKHAVDLRLLDLLSTPSLRSAVETTRGRTFSYPLSDEDRTDTALYLLRTQRPDLLLLHLFELDFAEHDHGPLTPQALQAVEQSDVMLGRVLAALVELGLAERSLVTIVSDHGFLPVEHKIQPNTVLRQAGLLSAEEKGKVRDWRAYFQSNGGSASLYLRDPTDSRLAEQVRGLFAPYLADPGKGLYAILGPEEIAARGGAAEFALALDAREGFMFGNDAVGPWSVPAEDKGAHGFDPYRSELYASLILAGPGLARKGDLGVVQMTAIAPTLAAYLGLEISSRAAKPLLIFAEP